MDQEGTQTVLLLEIRFAEIFITILILFWLSFKFENISSKPAELILINVLKFSFSVFRRWFALCPNQFVQKFCCTQMNPSLLSTPLHNQKVDNWTALRREGVQLVEEEMSYHSKYLKTIHDFYRYF